MKSRVRWFAEHAREELVNGGPCDALRRSLVVRSCDEQRELVDGREQHVSEGVGQLSGDTTFGGGNLHRHLQHPERRRFFDFTPSLPTEYRRRVNEDNAPHDRIAGKPHPLERPCSQPRDRVVARCQRGLGSLRADARFDCHERRFEERLLVGEVVVERAATHPGMLQDRLDRGSVEASLGEQSRCDLDQLLAGCLAALDALVQRELLDKPTVGM